MKSKALAVAEVHLLAILTTTNLTEWWLDFNWSGGLLRVRSTYHRSRSLHFFDRAIFITPTYVQIDGISQPLFKSRLSTTSQSINSSPEKISIAYVEAEHGFEAFRASSAWLMITARRQVGWPISLMASNTSLQLTRPDEISCCKSPWRERNLNYYLQLWHSWALQICNRIVALYLRAWNGPERELWKIVAVLHMFILLWPESMNMKVSRQLEYCTAMNAACYFLQPQVDFRGLDTCWQTYHLSLVLYDDYQQQIWRTGRHSISLFGRWAWSTSEQDGRLIWMTWKTE